MKIIPTIVVAALALGLTACTTTEAHAPAPSATPTPVYGPFIPADPGPGQTEHDHQTPTPRAHAAVKHPTRPAAHTDRVTPRRPVVKHTASPATVTTIPAYVNCDGNAQPCIDAGHLTFYAGNILAGHNYMGWSWLDDLPVGRVVRVPSGVMAGTYRVTGHMRLNHQGGAIPSFGGAALVLQTCAGSGTGFSLLSRI